MVKYVFSFLMIVLLCFHGLGQWGGHVAQLRPRGMAGMVFENQIGFGTSFYDRFEDSYRFGFDVSFYKMRLRLNEIPAIKSNRNNSTQNVYLGSFELDKYYLYNASGYLDFAYLDREKFRLYAGVGLNIGVTRRNLVDNTVDGISSDSGILGYCAGIFYRGGIDYLLTEKFSLDFSFSSGFYAIDKLNISAINTFRFGLITNY